jgi:CRISPR-associated protein Cmr3
MASEPWQSENRLGLARTEARIARDGFLYQAEHLRFVDGTCLLAQAVGPPSGGLRRATVPLGGESRLADVGTVSGIHLPAHPGGFPQGRVAVYLATPALFPGGWFWHPAGARLVGVALGGPVPVGTASPRSGMWRTRVLRWAVPAGSVYFLEFDDPGAGAALAWVKKHHGTCLAGQVRDRDGLDRLRSAGFGLALMGRW